MRNKILLLRLLFGSFCIVNLTLGLIACFSMDLVLKVADVIYGAKLTGLEPHVVYIVKMMGCALLGIAVMNGMAIKDPVNSKPVIYGNIAWLLTRVIQRISYIEQFHQDWGISYAKLWGQAIFVFLVAVAFLLLIPKKES